MDKHFLSPLFSPKSIAVFAGSNLDKEDKSGLAARIYQNLREQHFDGIIRFLDISTSGTLADLALARLDLAIIALPLGDTASALEIAARMGCAAALVISSGIQPTLADELKKIAQREGIKLLGPNSLGFQVPRLNLNACVAGKLAAKGSLALVSQSGALTSSMLDWAGNNGVGFSNVVSLGANTSVDIAQMLDYLANDGNTQSIIVYMEGIHNARSFMSALRSAANAKPVVILKAGRKPAGNIAAKTHSGTIVGSDDVFEAALRRAGAVRVNSFVELFSAAKCLASRYRPVGTRLAIVTNGGGPGVLAADWVNTIGLQLGVLSENNAQSLRAELALQSNFTDLIDLTENASAEHYKAALLAAEKDPQIDGVLALYSPKVDVDSASIADAVVKAKQHMAKPLLACWMGDESVSTARVMLNEASIPSFRTPEAAVGAFNNISTYYRNQRLLQQTPPPLSTLAKPDIEGARLVIESVLAERRKVLTEMESKSLLAAFHIPVTNTVLARTANEAMMVAAQMGFPVAMKIDSPDISHKSDVDGVALNIMNSAGARDNFNDIVERVKRHLPDARINGVTVQRMVRSRRGREVYVGLVRDDPFGPVIVFGAGGTMIELIRDRAMELPPLNQFLAQRLIERARVSETLGEWRGAAAVSMDALESVLLRVSEMVCELPQLREMDINPIIVDDTGAVAVDARIVIDNVSSAGRPGKYGHLAILPYPARFEQTWPLQGGGEYSIRPIHPDDASMLQELVQSLSPESRYFRFVSSISELPANMLSRFTLIDYDREMALVAVSKERVALEDGSFEEKERIIGVSRYITNPDHTSCEFSLLVSDSLKGKGLGSRLMESIMEVAREKGLSEIIGLVLANNSPMLKLMRSLGFSVKSFPEDPDFKLVTHPL